MGDHAHVCFIVKIILNLTMNGRIGIWDIHLILLLFLLVSLNSFNWYQFWHFLYTHIFSYMYACISKNINFNWYLSFHTYIYICFSCAYYIPISLSTNLVYNDKLELQPCFNWFSFQLVSYFKHMHIFIWYFIKGEKTSILFSNWYFIFQLIFFWYSTPLLYDRK